MKIVQSSHFLPESVFVPNFPSFTGMDGIKTGAPCPPQRDATAQPLPSTLGEALEALCNDHVMCEALGQEFVEWFVLMKNETEISKLEQDLSKNELAKERNFYLVL